MEKARLDSLGALEVLREIYKDHMVWTGSYCFNDRHVRCSIECPLLKIQTNGDTGLINYRLACADKCLYVGYPTLKDLAITAVEKLK